LNIEKKTVLQTTLFLTRIQSEAVPAEDVGLDILRRKLIESPRSRGLTEQIEKIEEVHKIVELIIPYSLCIGKYHSNCLINL